MIDAHHHFWRLSRGDYPWPDESVAPIRRDYGPQDLGPHLEAAGVERTVLVQATATVAETEFLLEIAQGCDFVAGVVGWVDLASPDALATIDRLRGNRWLKGLRPMLQSIDDPDWILGPQVAPALAYMSEVGLCFDALVQPRHLRAIAALADSHPDLAIVVDHLAKPAMGEGRQPDAAWRAGMRSLGGKANVRCKLSGMVTEAGANWRLEDLRPFADIAFESFGPNRILWGSDWPVVDLVSDYAGWVEASHRLLADLADAERQRVFGANAIEFYGLS